MVSLKIIEMVTAGCFECFSMLYQCTDLTQAEVLRVLHLLSRIDSSLQKDNVFPNFKKLY